MSTQSSSSSSLFSSAAQKCSTQKNGFLASKQVTVLQSDSDDSDEGNGGGFSRTGAKRKRKRASTKPKRDTKQERSALACQVLEHFQSLFPDIKQLQTDHFDRTADCARVMLKILELLKTGQACYNVCCRLNDLMTMIEKDEEEEEEEGEKEADTKQEVDSKYAVGGNGGEEQISNMQASLVAECRRHHDPNGLAVLLANNNHERMLGLFLGKFLPFIHLAPLKMCDIWYILYRFAFRKFERKRESDLRSSLQQKEQDGFTGDHWHNEKFRMMLDPLPKCQLTVVLEEDPPRTAGGGQYHSGGGGSLRAAIDQPSWMYLMRAIESHSQERDGINFRQRKSFLDTALMILLDCESNLRFHNRFVESRQADQRRLEDNKQIRLDSYEVEPFQGTDPASILTVAKTNSKYVQKMALEMHGQTGTGIAKFGARPSDLIALPNVSMAVMLSVLGSGTKCAQAVAKKYKNMRGLIEAYERLEGNEDAQRLMLAQIPLDTLYDPTKKRQRMTVGKAYSSKVFEHVYQRKLPQQPAEETKSTKKKKKKTLPKTPPVASNKKAGTKKTQPKKKKKEETMTRSETESSDSSSDDDDDELQLVKKKKLQKV